LGEDLKYLNECRFLILNVYHWFYKINKKFQLKIRTTMVTMNFLRILKKNQIFFITVLIIILGCIYYFWLHRKPTTQNAFVVADVRPITALVPGQLENVYVKNNEHVKKGQKLFTIKQKPYVLAVERYENELNSAKYKAEAYKEMIKKNNLLIVQVRAKFENAEYLAKQAELLYSQNAVSQKHSEELTKKKEAAKADLDMAKADLSVAKQQYQQALANIKSLKAQLGKSKFDLEQTAVYAMTDGYVTNMYLSPGGYVIPGITLFAFVSTDIWWIQANIKETELTSVKLGQKVKIYLWEYPGVEFEGVVCQTKWSVTRRLTDRETGMAEVIKENEWFMLPQRFPVQIKIVNPDPKYPLHPGASANVRIETSNSPLRSFFWQFFQI
jgi:multidrug resistance efflux pump